MFNFLRKLIPGGIHPPQKKTLSNKNPIQFAGIPERLYLPLEVPFIGELNKVVAVGDNVTTGQLLAFAKDKDFAQIHAPVDGLIESILQHPLPHASGMTAQTIVLKTQPETACEPFGDESTDFSKFSPEDIIQKIHDAGIIGMGGAGYPTYLKTKFSKNVDTLILNGAECEPFITCDDRLMQDQTQEIVAGARILQQALKAKHILFAVEDNKPNAAHALQQEIQAYPDIELKVIETIYPTGGQKQLVQILFGHEIEKGKHLPDYGLQMFNISTARATYDAVVRNKPVLSRVVTVTGENIQEGQNFEVLIGTPFQFLIDQIAPEIKDYQLIMGGPMMGVEMPSSVVPVVKTTNCILLKKPIQKTPHMPCIRCGSCADACPMSLMPQQMYWFAKDDNLQKAKEHQIMDCIECGCCAYVCPSEIPLVQYYRHAKAEIKADDLAKKKAEIAKQRHEAQLARIEAEKKAREERLKKKKETVKQQHSTPEAKNKVSSNAAAAKERAQARARAQIEKAKVAEKTNPIPNEGKEMPISQKPIDSNKAAAIAKAKALAAAKARAKAKVKAQKEQQD